eukprot:NODE_140_length_16098_cov_0.678605.p10 type:complete len:234 gc:universal NODE_140_length_16098_cov_0.678605:1593-2294(+)
MTVDEKLHFQKRVSALLSRDCESSEARLKRNYDFKYLIENSQKAWILERNYDLVLLHEASSAYAIRISENLAEFISGLELIDCICDKCYEFPKSMEDRYYVEFEKSLFEIIKFVEFSEDWAVRAKLLLELSKRLRSFKTFAIPLLPNLMEMIKIFGNPINKNMSQCCSGFLEILAIYEPWLELFNRHLHILIPILSDLLNYGLISKKDYFKYQYLSNFEFVHSKILLVYPSLK